MSPSPTPPLPPSWFADTCLNILSSRAYATDVGCKVRVQTPASAASPNPSPDTGHHCHYRACLVRQRVPCRISAPAPRRRGFGPWNACHTQTTTPYYIEVRATQAKRAQFDWLRPIATHPDGFRAFSHLHHVDGW